MYTNFNVSVDSLVLKQSYNLDHVMLCKLAFFSFLQVVETIVKVSPQRGTELFAPVLLKICHMILEVEVILLSGSHC